MDTELIESLCGNSNTYLEILSWLKEERTGRISNNSCILVVGNSCIGKTYSMQKMCEFLNMHIIHINSFNCYNSVQFKDIVYKSSTSSLIQSLENSISRHKVIIVDNFDSLFSADKTLNQTLMKILAEQKFKNIPIICIANRSFLKKIGDIKKMCRVYELENPSKNDIERTLQYMKIDKKTINNLLNNCNNNINTVFEGLKNKNVVSHNEVDEIYDIKQLYQNDFKRHVVRNILNCDSWLIPLRFHENMIIELQSRIITLQKKNRFYRNYMLYFCDFDGMMYKDNIEVALEFFVSIVYNLSQLKSKRNMEHNMEKFTKILSYLSLQKKYLKNSYNNDFPLYQIGNYHISFLQRKFIYFN